MVLALVIAAAAAVDKALRELWTAAMQLKVRQ